MNGRLTYNGRKVDPSKFQVDGKDLSKLKGVCKHCGSVVSGSRAVPSPDPYSSEIGGDDTPVVECDDCRIQSAQDI
jgi:hypothetical protein